jgi:hypothetical protein
MNTETTIAASNQRCGAYTTGGRLKSWAIIALTLDGAIYCANCADTLGISEANWTNPECSPVFADTTVAADCDHCHEEI